jgi:cytochrome c556
MKLRWIATIALLLVAATSVHSQNDPIAARRAILKGFGDATKAPAAMLKGEAPFDLAKVKMTLQTYSDGVKKLPALFPENSKTGGDTAALPKIWEDKARFESLYAKLGKDADANLVAIVDEASFKREFPKQLGDCKTCHDDYRAKKQ